MAWIELHQELAEHRKLDRLIQESGAGRDACIGRLCLLWLWALGNRPDGDLSGLDAQRLARITCVKPRQAAPFLEALVRSGFLDRDEKGLRVHDWNDYAGRLLETRRKVSERKRRSREKQRDGHGPVTALPYPTQPYPTQPDQTEPDLLILSAGADEAREAAEMEEYLRSRGLLTRDWLGATPELIRRAEILTASLFEHFSTRQPTRGDLARVFPRVTRLEQASDPPLRRWDLKAEGLLRYAFEQAERNGKAGVWSYIEGVLLNLHRRGIGDLDAAEDYDWEREEEK